MNQCLALPGRPDAAIQFAIAQHIFATAHTSHQFLHISKGLGRVFLDFCHLFGNRIACDAGGVAQGSAYQNCVQLIVGNDLLSYLLVQFRFLRVAEAD